MANYSTNLKTWGSGGNEYPTGYNYLEGEQPVDSWDNFFNANAVSDLKHLIDLTNKRIETDKGSSRPSPESSHLWSDEVNGTLEYYDQAASAWHRLLKADGDTMSGDLDMDGNAITDQNGQIKLADATSVQGADLGKDWFSKQEGGTVADGAVVPIGTFGLEDGETLKVTQAMLTQDGFTTPAADGIELVIADETSTVGDPLSVTTVLAADGTTLYDDETGSPLASFTNDSGGHLTVIIGIDNGRYVFGAGSDQEVHGGFIARVE